MMPTGKKELLLEFNIPFCRSRCTCCSGETIANPSKNTVSAYMDALERELIANAAEAEDCRVSAVRISGSMQEAERSLRLLRIMRENFDAEDADVTLCADPRDISADSLIYYRRGKVTRYDLRLMGLGYAQCNLLRFPDPTGPVPVIKKMLHTGGCVHIGAILVYGLKGLCEEDWHSALRQFLRFELDHLTLIPAGPAAALPDEAEAMLDYAGRYLLKNGFIQYAPCRFALPGREDPFYLKERAGAEKLSLGLSAVSALEGTHTHNTGDLDTYLQYSGDFRRITVHVETASN